MLFLKTKLNIFLEALQLIFQAANLKLQLLTLACELAHAVFECARTQTGIFLW